MAVQPAGDYTPHRRRQLPPYRARFSFSAEFGKHARTGPCHPRGAVLPEPCQMTRNLGVMTADHRFKVVSTRNN